jgi:hypothetical protein
VCGPVEVKAVENLWMIGEFPVDGWTMQFFFDSENDSDARDGRAFAIRFA